MPGEAATSLARSRGAPEVISGLTRVAIGTSLPELAATVIALVRNESALAVGNIVGSNIFNLLLVGGITAFIRPIPIPDGAAADLVVPIEAWSCVPRSTSSTPKGSTR